MDGHGQCVLLPFPGPGEEARGMTAGTAGRAPGFLGTAGCVWSLADLGLCSQASP